MLLREKHELERRLAAAAESERNGRAGDEALLLRLKRDLKRTKALLRDTQAQLERQKAETPGKFYHLCIVGHYCMFYCSILKSSP